MESVGRLMEGKVLDFYRGKSVLLTGHTGFKGSWLSTMLVKAGANVTGFSSYSQKGISLLELSGVDKDMACIKGDIRDYAALKEAFNTAKPEIVLHLAAQPIVLESYLRPLYTYETNVMGTANLLECVRHTDSVRSVLNVTTDKVYKNNEWEWGYRENDPLDGFDPYSNSKSCSELVTHSYASSLFGNSDVAVSTARAGNVIGGGDFAANRIIPDCVRAVEAGTALEVRNPFSTRPYQHVLEPLFAYLLIAKKQMESKANSGWYNVGPDECDCVTTGELVRLFAECWGDGFSWVDKSEPSAFHEANFLKLDCSKIKTALGWLPRWHITDAVQKTIEWTKAWLSQDDVASVMLKQIEEYRSV